MKKLFVLFTVLALSAALFAGCAAKNNTPTVTTTLSAIEEASSTASPVETTIPEAVKEPEAPLQNHEVQTNSNNKNTDKTTAKTSDSEVISKEEAKAVALKHAGLTENEISRYKAELDKERNVLVYEIEFDSGKYEYDYDISAADGKVLKSEKELRD